MLQFVFFFIPLLINTSSENVFVIGIIDEKPKPYHFQAYPYDNLETEKQKFTWKNRNKIFAQIGFTKKAIEKKKAWIYFSHLSSIKFYIDYYLEADKDFQPLKQKLLNCYERIKENTLLSSNEIKLIPDSNSFESKLIQILEDISNNPSRTSKVCNKYLTKIKEIELEHPKKTLTLSQQQIIPYTAPKNSHLENRWSRIKHAISFIKKTFKKRLINFSDPEKKEYTENKFYIQLVDGVLIGTFLIVVLTSYLFIMYHVQRITDKMFTWLSMHVLRKNVFHRSS